MPEARFDMSSNHRDHRVSSSGYVTSVFVSVGLLNRTFLRYNECLALYLKRLGPSGSRRARPFSSSLSSTVRNSRKVSHGTCSSYMRWPQIASSTQILESISSSCGLANLCKSMGLHFE